jgi:hypothetical protein
LTWNKLTGLFLSISNSLIFMLTAYSTVET